MMGDFGDLVRETLVGAPGLGPGPRQLELDERTERLDRRMRTVNWLLWLGVVFGAALAIVAVVLLATADDSTATKWLVLWGALFVWGILIIAVVKLWHFQMQSDTALAKELFRTQELLPEVAGRDDGAPPGGTVDTGPASWRVISRPWLQPG